MSQTSVSLSSLVCKLNDGIDLFDHATRHTAKNGGQEILSYLRHRKNAIAANLNVEISREGAPPRTAGTWLGTLRLGLCDIEAKLAADSARPYLHHLKAQQSRVLKAFTQASQSDPSPRVRELAQRYLPDIQYIHDEIDALGSRAS